jgi:hypothetical protein
MSMKASLRVFAITQLTVLVTVVVLEGLFYLLSGFKLHLYMSPYLLWGPQGVLLTFLGLEFVISAAVLGYRREMKIVHDEREQLIELKSYKATYIVLMAGIGLYFLFSLPATNSGGALFQTGFDPMMWMLLLGTQAPALAKFYYRRNV